MHAAAPSSKVCRAKKIRYEPVHSFYKTEDGSDPRNQVSLMNSR